jgi:hypothetical protein
MEVQVVKNAMLPIRLSDAEKSGNEDQQNRNGRKRGFWSVLALKWA